MRILLSKLFIFVFALSANSYSQSIDEEFLNSLPPEMQQQLLESIDNRQALEQPQYRRPSTFIQKPNDIDDTAFKKFGSEVFSMMQTTLMPINEPNFDSSYILDYGDVIELQLIGQASSITELPIKRDGSINIDNIGKLYLAGLPLENAINLIKAKIDQTFIGVEAFITLKNVRDIQVILAGNVFNPGVYTLNGNSNIFHALTVAGGPSDGGSFRKIDLVRENNIIESIDLYDTFIFGKSSFDKRLRSGDIVFVHPQAPLVTVSGAFKREGTYELLPSENLSKIIVFANGIDAYADLENISLQRIIKGRVQPIKIKDLSDLEDYMPQDEDTIFLRRYPFRNVNIDGAVLNPGSYLVNEGDTIHDVIDKAGGFSVNAYPFGGIYENQYTKQLNQKANSILYEEFLETIVDTASTIQGSTDQLSALIDLLGQLKDSEPTGRIIIDFENRQNSNSLKVKDGDNITIPEYIGQVFLFGELSSQGAAEFVEGESIEYYLNKVGGLNNNADPSSIFIYQPNGESVDYNRKRNIFQSQNREIPIYSGTIIYVPRKVNNELTSRIRTQAYASILSSLAVSLASVSVLNN